MEEGAREHEPPSARLDRERFVEVTGGDAGFQREIVSDYLERAWALFEAGTRALEARDATALRRVACALKDISRVVGAEGVAQVAARLESVADGSTHGAAPLLGRALACLIATERELEDHFGAEEDREAA